MFKTTTNPKGTSLQSIAGKTSSLAILRLYESPQDHPLVLFDPDGLLTSDRLQKTACSAALPPDNDSDDCDDPRWIQAWIDYLRCERAQGRD